MYLDAVKEAEEARAESQYHEEQFTRMAIETSKVSRSPQQLYLSHQMELN